MRSLSILSLLLACSPLFAQEVPEGVIFLRNPSFEDLPRNSYSPRGWQDCGFPTETPPDVHPDPENQFRVSMPAQDGNTFLGMVTRDNETWERVGQQLTEPLVANQCYELRIRLARSNTYLSRSRSKDGEANYVTPVRLRLHGGFSGCDAAELIGQSEIVSNYDWREYRIKLEPTGDFTHILIEAYYKTPVPIPYNGNILVDNASPLVPIACDKDLTLEEPPLAFAPEVKSPEQAIRVTPVPKPRQVSEQSTKGFAAAPAPPRIKLGKTEATLKEGQVFAIENIAFKANSSELEDASEDALQEIVGFLQQNDNVIVEIGGHASYLASKTFASEISQARAKQVIAYLKTYDIGVNRMFPKGYGKTRPVCIENTAECNRLNQRVEVKILKLRTTK